MSKLPDPENWGDLSWVKLPTEGDENIWRMNDGKLRFNWLQLWNLKYSVEVKDFNQPRMKIIK